MHYDTGLAPNHFIIRIRSFTVLRSSSTQTLDFGIAARTSYRHRSSTPEPSHTTVHSTAMEPWAKEIDALAQGDRKIRRTAWLSTISEDFEPETMRAAPVNDNIESLQNVTNYMKRVSKQPDASYFSTILINIPLAWQRHANTY